MLKMERRIACTEALAVYELLEEDSKNKIPKEMLEYLTENSSNQISINLRADIPLDMQNISKEGWKLIKAMSEFI